MTRSNRLGALALAAAGVLFLLYPAVRPWHDESTVDGAVASMGSGAWVASHAFAMVGFVLAALGLLALRDLVRGPLATAAVVTTWIGAGLVLPYYGAEDFGLHAIARQYSDGGSFDFLAAVDAVRYQPVAVTMFGVGLLVLALGGVLAAVTVWRSGLLPRSSGLAFGLGLLLFLPQFFTPPPVRVAHGVLLAVGCVWLAVALWRAHPRAALDLPASPGPTRATVQPAAS
ncbi:hypothetical protein GCM10022251_63870 [Phytohabitans flavus]|uniref:DUF998 domain-containing protein n=1 Tax=Phytohabitans flavus TaxID=1076124 RepID=A0A6F8XVA7_9ACTN|nr:hypothetical protein [Phytohabitans flavus]BCB77671.1 hypothetical protein Pflav_040810 [Phytohabitans flavus]